MLFSIPDPLDLTQADLSTLQNIFPGLDLEVINDVYTACGQDVQRSTIALCNLSGSGTEDEDAIHSIPLDDFYYGDGASTSTSSAAAAGADAYQLGSSSLADWTATLESLSWQDTVNAVTGTLSTLSTNVTAGLTTIAESLTQFVYDLSSQADPDLQNNQGGRSSYAGSSQEGAPLRPHDSQPSSSGDWARATASSTSASHIVHRHHDHPPGLDMDHFPPPHPQAAAPPVFAKKDD